MSLVLLGYLILIKKNRFLCYNSPMLTLDSTTRPLLQTQKNLLAFSAGIDSTALFFLLQEEGIAFDIALVNYGVREESDVEERYAKTLAETHNLSCFTLHAPKFSTHFEEEARRFRYQFFERLVTEHGYENLITAHQLNDQLEWLLMRLTKGAGTVELVGLESVSKRTNYTILRPILHHSKKELLAYLQQHNQTYFIDSSNSDEQYERNYFRRHFTDRLIEEYQAGITQSLAYLREDKAVLLSGYRELFHYEELYILALEQESVKVRVIDRYLKQLGYLLSAAQREILQSEKSVVLGGVWAVEIVEQRIFISPYVQTVIPKKERERYRIAKIPPKVRGYCYLQGIIT